MVIDLNGNGTLTANDFILSGGVTSDNATHNVLLGNNAANTFHGGGGFDYLYGSAGNDKLYGEGDSDMVRGGDGDDLVNGGAGDDGLYGGAGRDTFVTSSGHDIIQDFESGQDRIQVASSAATSFAQLSVTQQADGTMVEIGGSATALRAAGTAAAPPPPRPRTAITTPSSWPASTPTTSRRPTSSSAELQPLAGRLREICAELAKALRCPKSDAVACSRR